MNKLWRILVTCTLISLFINIGIDSNVYAASSTSQQDYDTTLVETKLHRKILPNKFPVEQIAVGSPQLPPKYKNLDMNTTTQLPKTGSDTNFYGILGVSLLILLSVVKRYFRNMEGW